MSGMAMNKAAVDLVELTEECLVLNVSPRRWKEWKLRVHVAFAIMAIGVWLADKVAPFAVHMEMEQEGQEET